MTQISMQTRGPAFSLPGAAPNLAAQTTGPSRAPRKRLWDLASHYHCSIIGTCLSAAELRKLLTKLGLAVAGDPDHDLHGRGVGLAGRADLAGKLLNKMLDDRHQLTLKRYARAKSPEAIGALWREDVKSGDIPGAYWAVLTHAAGDYELTREAFGYVHMLSHLVGAANRADIRRLQALEERNAALAEKIERQQARMRAMAAESQAVIRQLQRELGNRPAAAPPPGHEDDQPSLQSIIADLRRQLDGQTSRRAAAEAQLARARAERSAALDAAAQARDRADGLQAEIDAVERGLVLQARHQPDAAPASELDGKTVLYVGGRQTQLPHLRQAAAARGARLLHHDGGIEDNDLMLAGLVNRADLVLFPVDCVSHSAVGTVKRTCRNAGKAFMPLRSAAVTSFIAALDT